MKGRKLALTVGAGALILAMGGAGVAYAATNVTDATAKDFSACLRDGSLYGVTPVGVPQPNRTCANVPGSRAVTWSVSGPSGPAGPAGTSGSPGAPGAPGASGLSLVYEGTYNAGTTYSEDQFVSTGGSSYVSRTNGNKDHPTSTTTNWGLLAKKGTSAPAGYKELTAPFTVAAGAVGDTASVTCASGDVVLSGGYKMTSGSVTLQDSYPTGSSWKVTVDNDSTSAPAAGLVYAVCAA